MEPQPKRSRTSGNESGANGIPIPDAVESQGTASVNPNVKSEGIANEAGANAAVKREDIPNETGANPRKNNRSNRRNNVLDSVSALRLLCNGKSEEAISDAITYLDRIITMAEDRRRDASQELFNLQGLSILLFSLDKYQDSADVVGSILGVVTEIMALVEGVNSYQVMHDLKGVETILFVAGKHADNVFIAADAVSVLLSVALDYDRTAEDVLGIECWDFCIQVMKKFPNHMHAQSTCVRYLTEMTKYLDFHPDLIERKVVELMMHSLRLFRGKRKYRYEFGVINESMKRLFG